MWPDAVAEARICLAKTGIEKEDIINYAILVVIILREIDQS